MNVLVLSPGQDTGGQGIRIKQAFDRYASGWNVRAIHGKNNYMRYPGDLFWDPKTIEATYAWADLVHHKNRLSAYPALDHGLRKPTVIHHQGTRLRDHVKIVNEEARSIGAVPVVSTLDLLHCTPPGTVWLPSPYDLEFLKRYRQPGRGVGRAIRICHAPTNRRVKSTQEILRAIGNLSKRYNLVFDLIEQQEWRVTLSRKGRCDIYVDQLILGIGNNALEAWGMGIPVIAGVEDIKTYRSMKQTWGEIPFYRATVDTIEARLEELIKSAELREEWGQRGLRYVQKFHSEPVVVELLQRFWSSVPPSLGAEGFKPAATDPPSKRVA